MPCPDTQYGARWRCDQRGTQVLSYTVLKQLFEIWGGPFSWLETGLKNIQIILGSRENSQLEIVIWISSGNEKMRAGRHESLCWYLHSCRRRLTEDVSSLLTTKLQLLWNVLFWNFLFMQEILARVANNLETMLNILCSQGFRPLRSEYLGAWLHSGQKVCKIPDITSHGLLFTVWEKKPLINLSTSLRPSNCQPLLAILPTGKSCIASLNVLKFQLKHTGTSGGETKRAGGKNTFDNYWNFRHWVLNCCQWSEWDLWAASWRKQVRSA